MSKQIRKMKPGDIPPMLECIKCPEFTEPSCPLNGRPRILSSITRKIAVLLILPTLGAAVALMLLLFGMSRTTTAGVLLNVVGQQSTLSIELSSYSDMVSVGREEDRNRLRDHIATYDRNLAVITQGGPVMNYNLPPAPPEFQDKLVEMERLWRDIKPALLLIVETPINDPAFETAYSRVRDDLPVLQSAWDRVAADYQDLQEGEKYRMFVTLGAIALLNLTFLFAGLWLSRRYITGPILASVKAIQRVRNGDYSHRLPVKTGDELAILSCAFNDMSETLARQIAERERTEAQLQHLAAHDPLTGLYNRRHLQEELERQLAVSRRHGVTGALMFLDLDDFKQVNDCLGHHAGDELLKKIALILKEKLRETDILSRIGGDEFAIILSRSDREHVELAAQRILHELARHTLTIDAKPVTAYTSIGIALFPEHGETVEELLSRADLAMYEAKRNGPNRYRFFTPDLYDQCIL